MRNSKCFILALLLVAPAAAFAGDGALAPVAELHRAVHEAFGLPEPVIVRLVDQEQVPPEHLPVIGLISSRAKVDPVRVVELHKSGLSYVEISQQLGAGPDVFYVPFESDPGPPYGKAWGYWKNKPVEGQTVVLSDDEVVALANVRLITDYYHVPPARAIELQRSGKAFVVHEVAGAGAPAVIAVTDASLSERQGYNLEGDDYSKVYLGTLDECQEACLRESRCLAYTYNTRDRMCYLKDNVGRYSLRADTVSGQKGN